MQDAKTPITVKAAYECLQAAGYPKTFVNRMLPEWWDNSLLKTSAGALQFALIVKQRLGLDVFFGQDGNLSINTHSPHTNFKHRADTNAAELNVAATLGIALARIAVRAALNSYRELPSDPMAIHAMAREAGSGSCMNFEGLLDVCWSHGIPVLFLKDIPKKKKRMTGMAVMVDGRPAILLGYEYAQHSKQLFVLAHELAHIVCRHVRDNGALIDEEISQVAEGLEGRAQLSRDAQENEADEFALALIRNGDLDIVRRVPRQMSSATLAAQAMGLGRATGIDPGHLILSYAKDHDDWIKATQALNFIEQRVSAVELVREKFITNVDLNTIGAESAEHLLTMQGLPE
ncbi:ImmA/IrrE family metallo-endopeptidase [Pseudomonas sp. SWRI111]|uniref:ImmA/IrrE family metallo-endopeptidase n=1 Tax=Pseudomonas sp. SWRI111 TaxID=2745507 RepID=UPI00164607F3|nr:ImmA/IrrE family metallo-endopeptidase [Pseudomonas sp. SWRI111]MBC3209872.1 ImmA/IrrE family metallo-endopeptidase [Pseudomonas sp. SWRI111]